jgi:hypothetical protein
LHGLGQSDEALAAARAAIALAANDSQLAAIRGELGGIIVDKEG